MSSDHQKCDVVVIGGGISGKSAEAPAGGRAADVPEAGAGGQKAGSRTLLGDRAQGWPNWLVVRFGGGLKGLFLGFVLGWKCSRISRRGATGQPCGSALSAVPLSVAWRTAERHSPPEWQAEAVLGHASFPQPAHKELL